MQTRSNSSGTIDCLGFQVLFVRGIRSTILFAQLTFARHGFGTESLLYHQTQFWQATRVHKSIILKRLSVLLVHTMQLNAKFKAKCCYSATLVLEQPQSRA